ncbi:MAG: HIT domain-containing protein [Proteobacteria bacterium]|nr:HIT domain-containing protein [Pseudomonadota bacterium]
MSLEPYDINNVFAKILRKEIPCQTIFENDHVLSFCDINPQTPVHIIVIPKGPFQNFSDFHSHASPELIVRFYDGVNQTIEKLALTNGYRLITNKGEIGSQSVPHYHVHILAGKKMGAKITPF